MKKLISIFKFGCITFNGNKLFISQIIDFHCFAYDTCVTCIIVLSIENQTLLNMSI